MKILSAWSGPEADRALAEAEALPLEDVDAAVLRFLSVACDVGCAFASPGTFFSSAPACGTHTSSSMAVIWCQWQPAPHERLKTLSFGVIIRASKAATIRLATSRSCCSLNIQTPASCAGQAR